MKVVSAEQMRRIDRIAIEERGMPVQELMEAAGRAAAQAVCAAHPEPGRAVVLCGKGNNGGDGLVAARCLHQYGWRVDVVIVEEGFTGAAAEARQRVPSPVRIIPWESLGDNGSELLAACDVAVDALLGTGARGAPRPPTSDMIAALNSARVPVVAIDIPSGLDADSGDGAHAVRAGMTVAIGLPKLGLLAGDGPEVSGRVIVENIGFATDLLEDSAVRTETQTPAEAAALLPPRPRSGHKGTFGLCVVAAGCESMPGAAALALEGALRSGCGLVRGWVPRAVRPIVAGRLPEVLLPSAKGETASMLRPLLKSEWEQFTEKAAAIVVGPGIGMDGATADFVFQVLEKSAVPVVVDADALNLLAREREFHRFLDAEHILTPHPGELARLLERPASGIQADRWQAAMDAADKFGCTVVLKGAGTLVATPGGAVTHIPTGNTALARGGSGDLLAGLIGGLAAQGCTPASAARLGAWVHGLAADIAARDGSPRGLTVSEIAARLPLAFRETEAAASQPS